MAEKTTTEENGAEYEGPMTGPDKIALALATLGVGYSKLAPGTLGSAIGVLLYTACVAVELRIASGSEPGGFSTDQFSAIFLLLNLVAFAVFCWIAIWSAGRAAHVLGEKDPQKVVIDEVVGQLAALMFIPLASGLAWIIAAFVLFRIADIAKPYPVGRLQALPGGLGICADDLLAGIYAGTALYAAQLVIKIVG